MADLPQNPGAPEPPPFQPIVTQGLTPPPPLPPPAKSGGGGALKIILIILGVIAFFVFLLVAVLMYGCYRVKKAIHVNNANGETSLSVPGMSMNANTSEHFTAADLGTELYPGATVAKSGNMRMTMMGSSVISATFLTSDSKDQVVAFYKDKLGADATTMDMGSTAILSQKKSPKEQVTVTVEQKADQHDGKTQFHIQHVTTTDTK